MINVLFFASIREKLQCESLIVDVPDHTTLAELKQQLKARGETWQAALSGNVLSAVNQEMVSDECVLSSGAEVAFFPPVTGG